MRYRSILAVCFLCAVRVASAATYFVDGTNGNDSWNGQCATFGGGSCGPKRTIAAAISLATSGGDSIVVADGVYVGPWPLTGLGITLRSENGASRCTLSGGNSSNVLTLSGSAGDTVQGFTFRDYTGIGISHSSNGTAFISSCVFRGGGVANTGISLGVGGSGTPIVVNCAFSDHRSSGMVIARSSNARVANCTFVRNTATRGGAIRCTAPGVRLSNCIFWGNTATSQGNNLAVDTGTTTVEYCDVAGGQPAVFVGGTATLVWSSGNIASDPVLSDVRIGPGSPCIDAGTSSLAFGLPATDIDGGPRSTDGDGNSTVVPDLGISEFRSAGSAASVTPDLIRLSTMEGIDPPSISVQAKNCGGAALNWTCSGSTAWLVPVSSSGSVVSGGATSISVAIDVTGLTPGDYTGEVIIGGADNSPQAVLVRMHVGAARRVPSQYATIQAAVNACAAGDGVLIADGVYTGAGNTNVDTLGKAIIVRGENGSAACVIDGGDAAGGFIIAANEGATTVIERMTIRNCRDSSGPAIQCEDTSPTIRDCVLESNRATGTGGALYAFGGSPSVSNCRFALNTCAGIYATSALGLTVASCEFVGNSQSATRGGAVYFSASSGVAQVTNSTFLANFSSSDGGAIYATGRLNSTNCDFLANQSGHDGGAVYLSRTGSELRDCVLNDNSAVGAGGAVYATTDNASTIDCVFARNSAGTDGGGAYLRGMNSQSFVTHCTFAANNANRGRGVCLEDCQVVFENNVAWDGAPVSASQIALIRGMTGAPCGPSIQYSCIEGGQVGITVPSGCSLTWGTGNTDTPPDFAFSGDPRLMTGSLAIDAASNSPAFGPVPTDLDGLPRPMDGDGDLTLVADMGAHEYTAAQPTLAVSARQIVVNVPVALTGLDPLELQVRNAGGGTLNWGVASDVAWLVPTPGSGNSTGEVDSISIDLDTSTLPIGKYEGRITLTDAGASNSPREVVILLSVVDTLSVPTEYATIQAAIDAASPGAFVAIADGTYTGVGNRDLSYHGKGITVRSENGAANCTIDCQHMGRGVKFDSHEPAAAILRGVRIVNGAAPDADAGGGVLVKNGAPTIKDCVIEDCSAPHSGGGIALYSAATVRSSEIRGCDAGSYGGGIFAADGASILDCTIDQNTSSRGGGLAHQAGSCRIAGCTISNNSTTDEGGGIHDSGTTPASYKDCDVIGNTAVTHGGGAYCPEGVTMRRVRFEDNHADLNGGGLWGEGTPFPSVLASCEFRGNSANRGGGMYILASGTWKFANLLIVENTSAVDGGGAHLSGYARVSNCTVSGNTATGAGGGVYFSGTGNRWLANSMVYGNSAASGAQLAHEFGAAPDVTLSVDYSDVQGGAAAIWTQGGAAVAWNAGAINVAPVFVSVSTGDYRLQLNSAGVDAGSNSLVPADFGDVDEDLDVSEALPLDLAGDVRFEDVVGITDTGSGSAPIVDMGCYEASGIYVAPACVGDLNDDNQVNLTDLSILLAHFGVAEGASLHDGDLNGDGAVNLTDLSMLLARFGTSC